jgi:type IV pilus assembly protein PilM
LPLSEVQADWFTIGQVKDDKGFTRNQILLISFPKEQIAHYKEIFKTVGLELSVIELESLSLVRGLVGTDPTHTLIVDIGSRSTDIVFAQNGYLKFASQSDFAGASITQALATSLGISPIRAEQLKREKGIGGDASQYELSTVMLPILDAILNEIRTAQFNYERQFPGVSKIERVILSGGGANLIGIERYIGKELGLPIVKAAPFSRIAYPSSIEPLVPELDTLLSVSLGLTL